MKVSYASLALLVLVATISSLSAMNDGSRFPTWLELQNIPIELQDTPVTTHDPMETDESTDASIVVLEEKKFYTEPAPSLHLLCFKAIEPQILSLFMNSTVNPSCIKKGSEGSQLCGVITHLPERIKPSIRHRVMFVQRDANPKRDPAILWLFSKLKIKSQWKVMPQELATERRASNGCRVVVGEQGQLNL